MANTYILIASVTVGSGGSSTVDFTSIPQTYTDLLLKNTANGNDLNVLRIRYNSTSASDYEQKVLRGGGTSTPDSFSNTGWDTLTNFSPGYINDGAYYFGSNEYYIPNYTGSTVKTFSGDSVTESNASTAYAILYAGVLNNTSAITSINLFAQSGNFNQHSTFYLYGIKKD
jgi:hypothetical protein